MNTAQVAVIGHRGARGLFPENTLEGFRAAAALGVSMFELDVGLTADGVVVVCHDTALDPEITRDASGAWLARPTPLIRALTMDELSGYDVGRAMPGSGTDQRFPEQRAQDGARIPTLASVLTALPDIRFIIEVKTDPAHPGRTASAEVLTDAVLAVLDEVNDGSVKEPRSDLADRFMIESFDWRVPRRVSQVRPAIPVARLTRPETVRERFLWWDDANSERSVPACVAAASPPARRASWAPEHAGLTEADIREAHGLGLSVLAWTVNQPADIRRLIDWGVDGLITDRPDLALAVIGR